MSTYALELPTNHQDTASWAAIAFIATYSSEAAPRTARAIEASVGERTAGPLMGAG